MKKSIITAVTAAAVMALSPLSVCAVSNTTIDQTSAKQSGDLTVSYSTGEGYMIVIPSGVTLKKDDTVDKSIKASYVKLSDSTKKVVVDLKAASNTADGESTFSAKRESSVVNYTIKAGTKTIKVGDQVASFGSDPDEQEEKLTFSAVTDTATLAGEHTEILTFNISVK
ncbi:hypothetical protein SAMN02910447_02698 [Ruminococcus sp. YE71]|uniref:hypothetical protein n=1 Tax=unclassified Ruminococcus TaxID=2608920 RepID=UPI0008832368|nr:MULTISPECIES: hypothetical protein [unclassified Ruminococcus]SDA26706.1 hypothetical protein SAMN02910446_02684 [Ruminococcus sp. YE78]SFW44414.1 hypothetical protein SAMN02910447_02698 [Ruminococcus sp. YE71]